MSCNDYDPDRSEDDYELIVRMYQAMQKRLGTFNLSGHERDEVEKMQRDMRKIYPRLRYILKRRGISG
jgi:hypothetical protein